jgi:NAD(P)H-hydrate epimerase
MGLVPSTDDPSDAWRRHALLSPAEMGEADRLTITGGVPGSVLMENAGRAVADTVSRHWSRRPVIVLCGPGNNGGDGFVMARHLDNNGWPVDLHVFARNRHDSTDADVFFDVLYTAGIPFTQYHPEHVNEQQRTFALKRIQRLDQWIVDGLFGTGLTRPLSAPYDWLVEIVNDGGLPVLAIDLPSGMDCDTGEPLGPTIRASHTATFVAWKRGFLHPNSKDWTGEVHTIDIGVPRKLIDDYRVQ